MYGVLGDGVCIALEVVIISNLYGFVHCAELIEDFWNNLVPLIYFYRANI